MIVFNDVSQGFFFIELGNAQIVHGIRLFLLPVVSLSWYGDGPTTARCMAVLEGWVGR